MTELQNSVPRMPKFTMDQLRVVSLGWWAHDSKIFPASLARHKEVINPNYTI